MPANPDSLSPQERTALFQTLTSLPAPQVDALIFAMELPPLNQADPTAPALDKVKALLGWVESPMGPGLPHLRDTLHNLLTPSRPISSQPAPDQSSPRPVLSGQSGAGPVVPARVVISYKRDVWPDQPTALALAAALRQQQHHVFLDQDGAVGIPWVERIRQEIEGAHALIVLLSEHSVHSEMMHQEVALAHELNRTAGKPKILPVRLAYYGPLGSPLNTHLDPLPWAMWEGPHHTPQLIATLAQALTGQPLPVDPLPPQDAAPPSGAIPHPTPAAQWHQKNDPAAGAVESPEGTMDATSRFYVERSFDGLALQAICRQGETVVIKGPRQMGKSSLLMRVTQTAQRQGKRVAYLDFQEFETASLANADDFYPEFCALLSDELDLADQVDRYWQNKLGNTQRCTRYLERYVLKTLEQPLVLAMDEVERTFDTPFRSDFFSMLRGWHNKRATKAIWKTLDLVLVTSTEPYQLIEDLNQSPFNVGQVLDLTDFTADQVADLNQRHGSPLVPSDLRCLMNLVHGHPYLVRKALYLVATGQYGADDLFNQADEDRGPFGDHLRHHLFRIYNQPELTNCFLQVVQHQRCPDEGVFFRLKGAGLVRRRQDGTVVPRCELYAQYFQQRLQR